MKHRFFTRLSALTLSLALLALPAARALTPEQAGQLLQEVYIDPVPQSVLEQPTVKEMVAALGDPYTEYFTPEEYQAFNASMSDASLVGIGVVFQNTEEGLLLEQVLPDSPALKAGLEAGDLIVTVDGNSVLGQDNDTVTGWIQGEEGTSLKVVYLRDGNRKTATLTRAQVILPATTSELIDDHIGYISCTTFGPETAGHFKEALDAYGDKATVWIVDLRSNSGGVTEAATTSAGYFTGAGEMAYLRDSEDQYGAYYNEDNALTLYPVIVLVDLYSASASEIFASAIRDQGAGIVVGTRTFGKGVAQSVVDQSYRPELFPDGDAIKITSHRFFTPAGNTTDQVGVIPDLLVAPEDIANVAYLLAGSAPTSDTKNILRADIDWRWFIDLDLATSEEFRDTFLALLQAIPQNRSLWLGTGGSDGWLRTDLESLAQTYGLDYQAPVFPDQDDSRYATVLSILKTYGLINGREDGRFHPQDTLTRAELCQLLAVALHCTVPTNESPYSDVADDAWYAKAVIAMSNMGLVQGIGEDTFRPDDPVDHQQLITIMGRLAQRLNMFLYNTVQEHEGGFSSIAGLMDYDEWAKESAWLLSYSQKGYLGNTLSLLWASADEIAPMEATTRDEAAYALYRLLSYTGILPA